MQNESIQDFSQKTWKEDLTLVVGGKQLHVAKNVLAYLSPVFDAMFSQPFSEKDKQEIELPGKEYESFLEFLRCIYPGCEVRVTEETIFQVLALADEYEVKQLLEECERFLRKYVKQQNRTIQDILKCLVVSERYHMLNIKDICVHNIEERQPTELADAEIDPQCKDTVFEIMKRVIVKQHVEKVKMFISGGLDQVNYGSEFDEYTNAKGAIIEFTVNNVSAKQRTCSPVVILWGIHFSALITYAPRQSDNELCFGLFLNAEPINHVSDWSCRFKCRLVLKNFMTGDRIRKIERTFKANESSWGIKYVLSEVLDPLIGYIKDDEVEIIIAFLAKKPDIQVLSESLADQ